MRRKKLFNNQRGPNNNQQGGGGHQGGGGGGHQGGGQGGGGRRFNNQRGYNNNYNNNYNNRRGNNRHRTSNTYEGKTRQQAMQGRDKFQGLAQDALMTGDRIKAEWYFQHAEHYARIVLYFEEQDRIAQEAAEAEAAANAAEAGDAAEEFDDAEEGDAEESDDDDAEEESSTSDDSDEEEDEPVETPTGIGGLPAFLTQEPEGKKRRRKGEPVEPVVLADPDEESY